MWLKRGGDAVLAKNSFDLLRYTLNKGKRVGPNISLPIQSQRNVEFTSNMIYVFEHVLNSVSDYKKKLPILLL